MSNDLKINIPPISDKTIHSTLNDGKGEKSKGTVVLQVDVFE
jgi:hypothetical protein